MKNLKNGFYTEKKDIETWLEWQKISNYLLHKDETYGWVVDVRADVCLTYTDKHTTIPIKFNYVSGSFDCANNRLENLDFAPEIVEGSFSCNDNRLTSLKGAPKRVDGLFHCQNNLLETLEGAPREVMEFTCANNRLTNLVGGPFEKTYDYDCSNNKLTSLEGAPEAIDNNFYAYDNELTSLKHCPKIIKGFFMVGNNRISSLEFLPEVMGEELELMPNLLLGSIQKETNLEVIRQMWRSKTEKKGLEENIAKPPQLDSLGNTTFKV